MDIGVGWQQCGPYHCTACGASEIGAYDDPRPLTEQERKTGWYCQGSEPGSSANVIGGRIVTAAEARDAYRKEFIGNPKYHEPGYVKAW